MVHKFGKDLSSKRNCAPNEHGGYWIRRRNFKVVQEKERQRERTINMVGSKPDRWIRSKSPGMTKQPDVSSLCEGRLRILKSGRCCQELWRADVKTITAREKRKLFSFCLLGFSSPRENRVWDATKPGNFCSSKFARENFWKDGKYIFI